MPTEIERIMEFHWQAPRSFSNCVEKPYGLIYYDPENADLHDGNHALIRGGDYDEAVADAVRHFRSLGIQPRIHSDLAPGGLAAMRGALARQGFRIEEDKETITMTLRRGKSITAPAPAALSFRRVRELDDNTAEITIREDGGGMWNVKRLRKQLANPWSHYIAGYDENNRAVTACLIENSMAGTARLEDVVTHPDHRGKGYARQLMRFVLGYIAALDLELFFLFTDNPTAIRIYEESGFAELPCGFEHWQAWLE